MFCDFGESEGNYGSLWARLMGKMGHFYTNFDVFVPRSSVMTNKIGMGFAIAF